MSRPRAHRPSLFFGPGEVASLRRKCASFVKPQHDALVAHAEDHLDDSPPPLEGDYEARGDLLQNPYLTNLLAFSFLHLLTDDPRYLGAARRWAVALAREPRWAGITGEETPCGNCGYAEAWGITGLAVTYDWHSRRFPEAERALLRDKLTIVTRGLHLGALEGQWWTRAYLHHDTWVALGGLGLGAMVLLDEVPRARSWALTAERELSAALDWLADDGAWPEGPAGWAFAMNSVVPFLAAYRRRFPDRPIFGDPWLRRTGQFRQHARTADGLFLGFGDGRQTGGYQQIGYEGGPTLRWLAAQHGDRHAQWLAAREWETAPNPYTATWEILFADPDVGEVGPEPLPAGVAFDNQQLVYARTGWDPDATLLGFRCDSLLGNRAASLFRSDAAEEWNNSITHVHADAASFGVWSRGEFAITMARYGQRGTEFQNSLLVDGEGQYTSFSARHAGRPLGRLIRFVSSRGLTLVEGDAARCYPPGLTRFTRRLKLVRPGVVFLFDDVAAARAVALEWRLHVDLAAHIELGDAGFTSLVNGKTTTVRLGAPSEITFGRVNDRWNHGVTMRLGDKTSAARFSAVIVPSLPSGEAPVINVPSEHAFEVSVLGATLLAAFGPEPGALVVPGRLAATGSAAITTRGPDHAGFLVADASELSFDGEVLLSASAPVTAAYERGAGGATFTVSAAAPAEVVLAAGFGARACSRSVAASLAAGSARVELRVPAGTSTYELTE